MREEREEERKGEREKLILILTILFSQNLAKEWSSGLEGPSGCRRSRKKVRDREAEEKERKEQKEERGED